MAYTTTTIANALIRRAAQDGRAFTQLQLQKLLYYVQGHALARLGRPAVREAFQAWKHGPVAPELYLWLRAFGDQPVTIEIQDREAVDLESADPDLATIVRGVYRTYGNLTGGQLVAMTHSKGGPWWRAMRRPNPGPDGYPIIPNETISEHFERAERTARQNVPEYAA